MSMNHLKMSPESYIKGQCNTQ